VDHIAVNVGNPMELLLVPKNGGNKLFQSPNQGVSVRDITPSTLTGTVTALAFATARVPYVGTSTGQLFVRESNEVLLPVTDYPGNGVQVNDIAVDCRNDSRVAIISKDGNIYYRPGIYYHPNGGTDWVNIRGDICNALSLLRCIELVSIGPDIVILVGGDPKSGKSGVVRTINPGGFVNVIWSQFGTGLAHVNVFDLHFEPSVTLKNGNPGGDLLLAGTFGRGAWIVPPPSLNDSTFVPNCMNLTENVATQTLTDFSLRLGSVRVLPPLPGTPANTLLRVVDQSPEPGTQVNVGTPVDLTLQQHLFHRPHS
jgi:hypothetical protein